MKFPALVKIGKKTLQKAKGPMRLFLGQIVCSAAIWYVRKRKERILWVFGFFCLCWIRTISELAKGLSAFITHCGVVKKAKKEQLWKEKAC